MIKQGLKYILCLLFFYYINVGFITAQVTASDCIDAVNICTNQDFEISPNGIGIQEITSNNHGVSNPIYNGNMPWGSSNEGCLLDGEKNSTWMVINIASDGLLEFSFGANGTQNGYYDWAMWSYNCESCDNITGNSLAPLRCNWNGSSSGGTGIANTLPSGSSPSNFEPALEVNYGDKFVICFSNYTGVNTNVPLDFFGTAEVSCNPISIFINEYSINVDTICLNDTAELAPSGGSEFIWLESPFLNDLYEDTVLVSPNTIGDHYFTVTSQNLCGDEDTATATITVLSPYNEVCSTCFIDSILLDSTKCNYLDGYFELFGSLYFESPGDSGFIVVKNCSEDSSIYSSPFSSPLFFSIDSITADSTLSCNIEAYFTAAPFCSLTSQNYDEPSCILYCNMDSISSTLSFCDSSDYSYDISGELIFDDAPPVGQLVVRNMCSEDSVIYEPPFDSPLLYQIEDIYGDGDINCSVYAYFTESPSCYIYSDSFTERRCIPPCEAAELNFEFDSCGLNKLYYRGEFSFTYPPATGQLIIEDCHGIKEVFDYPFTSPIGYSLDSVPADGKDCFVRAYFTSDLSCREEVNYIPHEFPVPSFYWLPSEPTIFNTDVKVIDESRNTISYEWELEDKGVINSFDTKDIFYNFNLFESGNYPICLKLTNVMGCEASLCDTINIENPLRIYVPTGFKPFGINSEFKPVVSGDLVSSSDYLLEIFDRNGNVIFKTTDINEGWNGRINGSGRLCSIGVYIWKMSVKEKSTDKPYKFMGNITMMR